MKKLNFAIAAILSLSILTACSGNTNSAEVSETSVEVTTSQTETEVTTTEETTTTEEITTAEETTTTTESATAEETTSETETSVMENVSLPYDLTQAVPIENVDNLHDLEEWTPVLAYLFTDSGVNIYFIKRRRITKMDILCKL